MKVVTTMACMLLWHKPAAARRAFLQGLAAAMAEPNTSTRAICMEKLSRPQKPLESPQALSTCRGPILVAHMEPMKTMMLRMMANRNASGSHRLTTRTQPLVNFLNTDSLSFILSGRGVPPPQFCPGLCAEQGRLWFYCIIGAACLQLMFRRIINNHFVKVSQFFHFQLFVPLIYR